MEEFLNSDLGTFLIIVVQCLVVAVAGHRRSNYFTGRGHIWLLEIQSQYPGSRTSQRKTN